MNKNIYIGKYDDINSPTSKFITEMKSKSFSANKIFNASPDKDHDLDGHLTFDKFSKIYFMINSQYENLRNDIDNTLNDKKISKDILFLYGFSGTGKTIFLNYFSNYYKNIYNTWIVDCYQYNEASLKNILIRYLIDEYSTQLIKLAEILNGLAIKIIKEVQYEMMFSIGLKDFLQIEIVGKSDQEISNKLYKLLHNKVFQMKDIFLLFIYSKFHQVINSDNEKNLHVIVFDNLDTIKFEHLTNIFFKNFIEGLSQAAILAKLENVGFSEKFRFIFCLREANKSLLINHIHDNLLTKTEYINFPLVLNKDLIRLIFKRRMFLVEKIYPNNYEIIELTKTYREYIEEEIFKNFYANIFNKDNRKLLSILFEIPFINGNPDLVENKYGLRGLLIHYIVDYLKEKSFVSAYLDEITPDLEDEKGYCYFFRMLVNFIQNTKPGILKEFEKNSSGTVMNSVSLFKILKDFSGIYSPRKILHDLSQMFNGHLKSWEQLISIYNKDLIEDNGFSIELKQYLEYLRITNDINYELDQEKKTRCESLISDLENIQIKITPAAINFFRHINIHFEFYSNICFEKSSSLFEFTLQNMNINVERFPDTFSFESITKKVITLVSHHNIWMGNFYKNAFENTKKFKNIEDFLGSDFSFKFLGKEKNIRDKGATHILRVISSHLDYLDNYRHTLYKETKSQYGNNQDLIKFINERFLIYIKDYIKILRISYDKSVLANNLCDGFTKNVSKIEENPFDTETWITRI